MEGVLCNRTWNHCALGGGDSPLEARADTLQFVIYYADRCKLSQRSYYKLRTF